MWESRSFLRQLVDWASAGSFSLEQMRRTRRNRKHCWTPQCLTNALEALHKEDKEVAVVIRLEKRPAELSPPQPEHARSGSIESSIEVARPAPAASQTNDPPLLHPHASTHFDDEFQLTTSDEPEPIGSTDGHAEDPDALTQEGMAVDATLGADVAMGDGDTPEARDDVDGDLVMVGAVPSTGRAHSPASTKPPTDLMGAASSLRPNVWLSGSVMDLFAAKDHRTVSNTFVDKVFEDSKALEKKQKLRLRPEQRYIILPLHLNSNHWTVTFFDLKQKSLEFADSLAIESKIPDRVDGVHRAFIDFLGMSPASGWDHKPAECARPYRLWNLRARVYYLPHR